MCFVQKWKYFLTFNCIVHILRNLQQTWNVTKSLILKGLNDLGLKVKVIHNLESQRSYVSFEQDCSNITKFDIQIRASWLKQLKRGECSFLLQTETLMSSYFYFISETWNNTLFDLKKKGILIHRSNILTNPFNSCLAASVVSNMRAIYIGCHNYSNA